MDAPRPRLVLASTSRYRRELLGRLGLPFEAVAPDYEEARDSGLGPEALVRHLAREKARSLRARFPEALILGADQVAELDGEVLGKPGTVENARAQLARLQGHTHRLLTGLCLLDAGSGRLEERLDEQRMSMRPLTEAQIAGYVEREAPLDCAGAYRIEGPGIALFERLQGEDYTGIIGLPLTKVVELLALFGVELP